MNSEYQTPPSRPSYMVYDHTFLLHLLSFTLAPTAQRVIQTDGCPDRQIDSETLHGMACVFRCGSIARFIFVAVFLGCTSTGRVGLCFLWFYVQELPKAQPAVVLVLKRLRRRGNGLVLSDRLGEAGNRTCDPWFTRHRFIPYTTAASHDFSDSGKGPSFKKKCQFLNTP